VALNIGADETERMLTWYSDSESAGEVQLAHAEDVAGDVFPANPIASFEAVREASSVEGFASFKATVTGLEADTEYAYRVGGGDGWSKSYEFKTAGFGGSFSFLAAGDPQIGSSGNAGSDTAGWTATLEKAMDCFPTQAS
jgi:hypothetical protein